MDDPSIFTQHAGEKLCDGRRAGVARAPPTAATSNTDTHRGPLSCAGNAVRWWLGHCPARINGQIQGAVSTVDGYTDSTVAALKPNRSLQERQANGAPGWPSHRADHCAAVSLGTYGSLPL
jgi:hypothetical protein